MGKVFFLIDLRVIFFLLCGKKPFESINTGLLYTSQKPVTLVPLQNFKFLGKKEKRKKEKEKYRNF